jgi:preprotein translocase subunit YajC
MNWHDLGPLLILAQQPEQAPEDTSAFPRLMFMLMAMFFLAWLLLIRPQRKKEQDLQKMISNLKEKDRVVTVGGIHGVVTNVRRDVDQVVIRVDEATGTKLHVGTSAIGRVITDDEVDSDKKDNGNKKS